MTKPVILLSANYETKEYETKPDFRPAVPSAYTDLVRQEGGIPLIVPFQKNDEDVETVLDRGDGVLMIGGPDVDPAYYGKERHPRTKMKYEKAQHFELELIRRAVRRGIPVMGICLGVQQINVALGGTLYQHLPEEIGETPRHHKLEEEKVRPRHMIRIEKGTLLYDIVGSEDLEVNSSHHQAIREVAGVLKVSARSVEDGVIEGVEPKERGRGGFVLGIQWHPEMMAEPGTAHVRLFSRLIAEARGKR